MFIDPRLGTDTSGLLLSNSMENLNLYVEIETSEPEQSGTNPTYPSKSLLQSGFQCMVGMTEVLPEI